MRTSLHLLPMLLLTAFAGAGASASEYLVAASATGEEGGSGSAEHPFTTVHQAVARAGKGDTIWVARGGTYREPAGMEFRGGVTVKAGGAPGAPAPVLTTSVVISAFRPWAKNPKVLTAAVDKRVLDCWVDGRAMTLARYPDRGWLRAQKGSTPEQILAPERAKEPGAAAGRWKGAQVRWRRWSWWWETRPITDDDGAGKLTLGAEGRFQDGFTGEGSAFYVDDSLDLLDAPGEWYYDQAASTFYLYPPVDAARKLLVEVATDAKDFGCGGATLDGLAFARMPGHALGVGKPSVIANCVFQDIGGDAIRSSWDSSGTKITGCTFADVHGTGISWLENPAAGGGTLIEGNHLERIGMAFGLGGSGSWHGCGMIINKGKGVVVRGNRLVDIGNDGVILAAPGTIAERNVLVRCMGSLNDGAALYACTNAITMRDNVVLDTVGNLETSHWWYPLGHGIWTEFIGDYHDHVITGNTIFGCGGNGLFLTNTYHWQVQDNVVVNNRLAAVHLSGKDGKAQDGTFTGNTLIAGEPARRLTFPENIPANWKGNDYERCIDAKGECDYGRMSGTTLVAVPGEPLISLKGKRYDDAPLWKMAAAWADPAPTVVRASALLLINDGDAPHTFAAPAGGWHQLDGKPIAKGLVVAPWRSVVVVRSGEPAGAPPYVLASGIDYRAPSAVTAPALVKGAKKKLGAP